MNENEKENREYLDPERMTGSSFHQGPVIDITSEVSGDHPRVRKVAIITLILAVVTMVPFLGVLVIFPAVILLVMALRSCPREESARHERILLWGAAVIMLIGVIAGILAWMNLINDPLVRFLSFGDFWKRMDGLERPSVSFRLLFFIVLIFSVILHESAHGLIAYWRGDPTAYEKKRISLNPLRHVSFFGSVILPMATWLTGGFILGWAKPVPVNARRTANPPQTQLLVSLAGPASNFILAFLFFTGLVIGGCLINLLPEVEVAYLTDWFRFVRISGSGLDLFWSSCLQLCKIGLVLNVGLTMLNLVPIPPLDGSWIFERLLPGPIGNLIGKLRAYGCLLFILLFPIVLTCCLFVIFFLIWLLAGLLTVVVHS